MNADVLTTRAADGIAVITLGSANRIYFDAEMGDALTETLDRFAGDPNVRVVIVTGGAPGYFNRHFDIPALIQIAESLRASGGLRTPLTTADSSIKPWPFARACQSR
jgi:enoyl-CoA hydratase/carnithine racemase